MAQGYGFLGNSAPAGIAAPQAVKPTGFDKRYAQQQAYNAPQQLQYGLQENSLINKLGYGQAGYGLDQQSANLGYQSDSRDLALQQGQNGLDLRAAQRQPQLLSQLLGLDNQEYDLQRGDAGQAFQKNLASINSDATARGAFGASGTNDQRGFNFGDLQSQMGHIGIAQDKNTLSATEQKQQAQDRIEALNMTASRLGMKGDELKDMLGNQLQKLGLNQSMSVEDILDGLTSNDLASKQFALTLIQNAGPQYATNGK